MYTRLMEVSRSDWEGQIVGIRSTAAVDMPTILTPLQPSPRGGSGTFLAADNSNNRWWIKPLNNLQGARVTVTEAIVGAAGRLIGAPVCETRIVVLPEELRGWEFRPGSFLEPGLAHASREVRRAFELRTLQHQLAFTLGSIPNDWPVTDVELECVGWFLERRSQAVASRLEVLTNGDGT